MRRLFCVLVLALCLLSAGLGSARASGFQTINPYHCPEVGAQSPWVVSAAESGGDPVQMKFGWGALQTGQLDKFISAEYGSITLTDPSGNVVYSDSWGSDPTGWEYPYFATTLFTPGGQGPYAGYGTRRFEQFGTLSNPNPGTDAVYHFSMDWELSKAVTDGFGAYGKGPILRITSCPIVVHNYNS